MTTIIDGIDYGPLACLIGEWHGDEGMDLAPEPDGDEHNPYFETIVFEAGGDVTNAEEQVLSVVPYRQVVTRKSTGKVFHHQVGYWLWDPSTDTVMQTLTIPRAVTVIAGGTAVSADGATVFEVAAAEHDADWGIVQAPFMRTKARTKRFSHRLEVTGDRMRYREVTVIDIYGKNDYEHTDENVLTRQ